MAFPETIDTFLRQEDDVDDVMARHINAVQTTCENVQIKVGVDNSSDTTSLDFLIASSNSIDPGHTHTSPALLLTASLADGDYCGLYTEYVASGALLQSDLVYLTSQGEVCKADAASKLTMECIGVVLSNVNDGQSGRVLTYGFHKNNSRFPSSVGSVCFVSNTAGDVTTTKPSGSGDQVQAVGVVASIHTIYFFISPTVTEIN